MTEVWLGVIAVCLFVLTAAHVRALSRLEKVVDEQSSAVRELRRDLGPLIVKANKVADDAGKVSALALAQMERVDQAFDLAAQRIDDTLQTVQNAVVTPVRQGAAVMAGLKAALAVFRARQDRARYDRDDEDALFIG